MCLALMQIVVTHFPVWDIFLHHTVVVAYINTMKTTFDYI